ncbi:MAG: hypothetical protein ACRENP_01320 [Longimicrobiales bacterium]
MRTQLDSFRWSCGSRLLTAALCACALLLGADQAAAQRKGFVLNLGVGPALTSLKATGFNGPRVNKTALGTDFKIGYAPSDRLLIYYSNDAAFFGSDDDNVILAATGQSGIGATYFLSSTAPSFYVQGGIGFAAFNEVLDDGETVSATGSGVNLGGGFEFARHWNVDVDLILGSVEDEFGGKLSIRTVRFAINWLLY